MAAGPPRASTRAGRAARSSPPALFHVLGARSQAAEGGVCRPLDLLAVRAAAGRPARAVLAAQAPIAVLAVAAAASIAFATFAAPRWTYAVAPIIALFSAVKAGPPPGRVR